MSRKISIWFALAGHPRQFRDATCQLLKGLCRCRALRSCLDSMTAGAQRLQIVDAVSSQRKGHDVVHQHGSGHPSALGTVPAQRLVGQHGVADALPPLVVTALVSGQAMSGRRLRRLSPQWEQLPSRTTPGQDLSGQARFMALRQSGALALGSARPCQLATWHQGNALAPASARPGRLVASHQRKCLRCSRPFSLYPLPPFS